MKSIARLHNLHDQYYVLSILHEVRVFHCQVVSISHTHCEAVEIQEHGTSFASG